MATQPKSKKQPEAEAKADAAIVNQMVDQNADLAAAKARQQAALNPAARPPQGRAVAVGRDGKPIWRSATASGGNDPYAPAATLAPDGWVYEWKRDHIHNKKEEAYHSNLMRQGGWSPVTHDRHPGVFGNPSATGAIIVGDQALFERPLVLHQEALREEKRSADEKMRRAKSERGLAAASSGIDPNSPDAKAASYVKQVYDPDLAQDMAAARPTYDRDHQSID